MLIQTTIFDHHADQDRLEEGEVTWSRPTGSAGSSDAQSIESSPTAWPPTGATRWSRVRLRMSTPSRFLVFSDGSALTNPGGPGGTGFVVVDRSRGALRFGGTRFTVDPPHPVTNNRMELRAVLEALEGLPEGETVEVVSDSRYVIDSLSKWIHGWRRKGWKTSTGTPVLNRDLIEAIDLRVSALRVAWRWVRGHDGHPVNELVDALASSAAQGLRGPDEDQVMAALRAGRVLAPRASPT